MDAVPCYPSDKLNRAVISVNIHNKKAEAMYFSNFL